MAKGKNPEAHFNRARARGAQKDTGIVNDKAVLKGLEDGTKRNHQRQLALWDQFAEENLKLDVVVSIHSLKWMKDFVKHVALGMDGQRGYDDRDSDTDEDEDGWIPPCVESVRNYWNNFTGAWLRAYADNPISEHIQKSVTQFIYGPLKDELKMPERKRARRYANRNHLYHFARQLWKVDWFEYCSPGARVVDWALTLAIVYSSARIGEYIESVARRGSGRGLRYKDIMVIVFLNEDDRPELAMQLTKDAKNMTNTPHRRPQHAFAEGRYPRPLYQNPLLPYLAIFLSRRAFRDYKTLQELFAITPTQEHRAFQIHWEEGLLDTPVFLNQSTKGAKRIENADAFGSRHRECGIRAGFPVPPTIHDWRAEGLFLTDKHYSPDARMGQAGQDDRETFHTNYQPRNAGVDGQATFLGDERRDAVNDAFRELTLPRNPNLWHSLPAAKQYEIENRQDWLDLEEKMATLKLEPDMDTKQQREEEIKLRKQKARLMKRELRKWQKKQPYQPGDPQGYHREIFARCSFMMPARGRLAEDMFEVADLRSPAGLHAIQDMTELCEKEREVDFRPGLEPHRCCCKSNDNTATDDSREQKPSFQERYPKTYDWSHIYKCFQETQKQDRGFAELCFLCSDWFFNTESWELHCQDHINDMENFPIFLDPLVFNGVLAMPGFCYNCLVDPRLPASNRMYQFKSKPKWRSHIQRHIDTLGEQPGKCELRTQQCSVAFNSTLELQFHLQDAHGIHSLKKMKTRKRRNNQIDEGCSSHPKKMQPTRQSNADVKFETGKEQTALLQYTFVNASIESVEIATAFKKTSKSSSRASSFVVSTAASSCGRRSSGSQTPLSSIRDEIQSGLESASHKELYVSDDDFVINESLEGGSEHQSDEDPYSSKDSDPMDIDGLRGSDLTAEGDATLAPYYSNYDTTKPEDSEMEVSRRAIQSQECDFIDIDDLLSASTGCGLPLPLSSIQKEAIETIDLTGIDDQEANDSQRACWNDSGYVSPGSPLSGGFVAFLDHNDCIEERRDGEKTAVDLDHAEDYHPESTRRSHQEPIQHVLSVIDPALTDPEDQYLANAELIRAATVTDLVLDEIETGPESGTDSEDEKLYNIEKIISHKMIKGVRYYRIQWEGYPSSANTWEPIDVLEECQDLVKEYHRKDECRRKAKRGRRSRR